MTTTSDLPDDLPVPEDDGACVHLQGSRLPSVALGGTGGHTVDLGTLTGWVVIYFYPKIGRADTSPPGAWNDVPGARGCTPQSCSFRDHHAELRGLGASVYGISAQPLDEQIEAAERLRLPFELLNDSDLQLATALQLPTFDFEGSTYIKRITLIARDGQVERVFYPVFPPGSEVDDVVAWIRADDATGDRKGSM